MTHSLPVLYNPTAPPALFDGYVAVHSTCRDCRGIMAVFTPDETVHPCCTPKPTMLESLATGWCSATAAGDTEAADLTQDEIRVREAKPPNLGAAAVAYAKVGWPVFPLGERSGRPAIPSAHPDGDPERGKCKGDCGRSGHGFHDATDDAGRLKKWWTKHPRHNIGLATGRMFDVIDVDPKNNGVVAFIQLLQTGRLPEVHGVAVTRSGGVHLYVKPKGSRTRPGIRQGIDYKALGGYVVAPPSTMGPPGRSYSWLCVPSPAIKGAAIKGATGGGAP